MNDNKSRLTTNLIDVHSKLLIQESDNIHSLLMRASCFIKELDFPKALQDLQKIVANSEKVDHAYYLLGLICNKKKDFQTGLSYLEKAISINHYHMDALYMHASCLNSLGRQFEALESYNRALELDVWTRADFREKRVDLNEYVSETNKPKKGDRSDLILKATKSLKILNNAIDDTKKEHKPSSFANKQPFTFQKTKNFDSSSGSEDNVSEFTTTKKEKSPNLAEEFHRIGYEHRKNNDYLTAIEYYSKAIDVNPLYFRVT